MGLPWPRVHLADPLIEGDGWANWSELATLLHQASEALVTVLKCRRSVLGSLSSDAGRREGTGPEKRACH